MEFDPPSIDEIRLWNVKTLQEFLRKRGLRVSGRKEELVALVFAAKRMPDYVKPITTEAECTKSIQYDDLLKIPNGKLPNPTDLKGWINEEQGLSSWPPTMAFDIGKYLLSVDNVPLRNRLMSDYKEGKAYSYFASGWVKEVMFHAISESSDFCFLMTECRPSQNINNIPWKVWVAIKKKTGEIHSGYCTCFAGFSGTCNHVAAILFKVDFAWRNGLTNPCATSRECGWNAFGAKRKVEPKPVSDIVWSKPKFSRAGRTEGEGINPLARKLFSPAGSRSTSETPSLSTIFSALTPTFKDACGFQYWQENQPVRGLTVGSALLPCDDLSVGYMEEVESEPPSLSSLADGASTVLQFLETIQIFNADMIAKIEKRTRGQARSEEWFAHRKGRITGSVVHSVLTRSRKLLAGKDEDNAPLLKRLLYSSPDVDLPALKYGREMEEEAKRCYIKTLKTFGHPKVQVMDCGLVVHSQYPFLAASPDGIVSCPCCGRGVLEIKCPYSIASAVPDSSNLHYINETDDGIMTLKPSHQYYSQVHLEMAVTNTAWCDFFVYTPHGYLRVRVPFDHERWDEIVTCSKYFFENHIADELVTKKIFSELLNNSSCFVESKENTEISYFQLSEE